MTNVESIFTLPLLEGMIRDGYIREQTNPAGDLRILNYTEKAAYEGLWNEATLACRGLILDEANNIVARPFRKFFNLGQTGAPDIPEGDPDLYLKADGSLGILYPDGHSWAIATRGSFTSPQALHATKVLHERYSHFYPVEGVTYLFEIIYPANRIVVDYHGMDDLILLGVVSNSTGRTLMRGHYGWPGPIIEKFAEDTVPDLTQKGTEYEGYVMHWPEEDVRLKVKSIDYVRLHRLMTNLDSVRVWEELAAGRDVDEWLKDVPDEFYVWLTWTVKDLQEKQSEWIGFATTWYQFIDASLAHHESEPFSRKDFALAVRSDVPEEYRSALFLLYDNRDITDLAWKAVRPERTYPFTQQEEAA